MSEFGEAADLARRAKALGVQEWELRVMEGSPDRKLCADLLADAFPRLRMTKEQLAKEDAGNIAAEKKWQERKAAQEAAEAERIAMGLGPTPPTMPSGYVDFGSLPTREPGHRMIDQLLDQEDAQWRRDRAKGQG